MKHTEINTHRNSNYDNKLYKAVIGRNMGWRFMGHLGQLYFAHDILKALEEGMAKFGGQLNQFQQNFIYSDDTEEAIVLYNHLLTNGHIIQDQLAMDFATRYMERDPDGEIFGYGLNTRKVLRDIYEGVPWRTANKIIKKSEGTPSFIDRLVQGLSENKGFKDTMKDVNVAIEQEKKANANKVVEGSCGNGSAMRVALLGAYLAGLSYVTDELIVKEASLQAEVTHCHPEGIAGAIAITKLASLITRDKMISGIQQPFAYYTSVLDVVPQGKVRDGIIRARDLALDTPLPKVIEVLGNGTHVTCQDTVPLCCYMAIKHLTITPVIQMYEDAIIETSKAFGDVDTNCAIVGGMIGIY